MSVGRSHRTPAKHDLMRRIVGKEVGAARHITAIERCVWIDLTAGDGIPADESPWEHDCSPGILAYQATRSKKRVNISLYEIKPKTYDRLIERLGLHLPGLGWKPVGDNLWDYDGRHLLTALNADGATVSTEHCRRTDAVLVTNDPNAITDWAMRPAFAEEIASRTPWFRSISTMGCNTGGLMRLSSDGRAEWFDRVQEQERALPRHRDLLLAAIQSDSAKWAYLLCEPTKWRDEMERQARHSFGRFGFGLDMAWFGRQRPEYEALKRRLFLTRTELGAS